MSLRHLILLSAAALISAAGAAPLEYAPPAAPRALQVEFGVANALANEVRLDDSLISASAARALMLSEMRTRALADGTAPPADGGARGRPAGSARHSRQDAYAQADPLGLALERMVNHRDGAGVPVSAQPGTVPAMAALSFEEGDAPVVLADGEEIVERVANVRQAFADALGEAVSLDFTEDGQIRFSLMGLEEFSASIGRGQVSLMFRDATLARAEGSAAAKEARGHAPGGDGERLQRLRLLFLLWDILTHPLTLAALVVFAAVRLLADLARSRPAF